MSEERIRISFKEPEPITLSYNDVEFTLHPYITVEQQVVLMNKYIEALYGEGVDFESAETHLSAEYDMREYVLFFLTNLETEGISPVVDEQFWEMITENVVNYYEFRHGLESMVFAIEKRKIAFDAGVILDLIKNTGEQITAALSFFSEITPEEIEKLKEDGMSLLNELKDTPLISDLIISRDTAGTSKEG